MLNIENLNFGYKKNESTLKNINLNVDSWLYAACRRERQRKVQLL